MSYRSVFVPGLFEGQTILVTGGGSGIGRCTAHELAALGAHVAIAGRKIEKLELDPLFRELVNHPTIARIANRVIGPEVVIYRALIMSKLAQGGTKLPWHQDGGKFWGIDREPNLQVWTALDDAPIESGCVEVFPKSHLRGLVTPLGGVVPDNHVADRTPETSALPVPAKAGESILIHNHCWHRSGTNTTGKPRRAFTVCYMDAATRCTRKKRAPRVFFPVFRDR